MVVPREQLGGLRLAVVRARGGQASKQKQQMPDTATAPTDMNNKLTEIACTKKNGRNAGVGMKRAVQFMRDNHNAVRGKK